MPASIFSLARSFTVPSAKRIRAKPVIGKAANSPGCRPSADSPLGRYWYVVLPRRRRHSRRSSPARVMVVSAEVAEQRREEEYERHPHYTWDYDGWRIVFFAIPRAREEPGKPDETVLYHFWDARRVEAQIALKDALDEKADRYGQLELPYVIAVDVLAIDSIGTDIGEILFGKEVHSLTRNQIQPQLRGLLCFPIDLVVRMGYGLGAMAQKISRSAQCSLSTN